MTSGPPLALRLDVGERRGIPLQGLTTSGYVWSAAVGGPDPDAVDVRVERRRPEDRDAGRIGVSSAEEAVLTGLRPGRAHVRLEQRRPWEHGAAPRDRLVLEVEVVAAGG